MISPIFLGKLHVLFGPYWSTEYAVVFERQVTSQTTNSPTRYILNPSQKGISVVSIDVL